MRKDNSAGMILGASEEAYEALMSYLRIEDIPLGARGVKYI